MESQNVKYGIGMYTCQSCRKILVVDEDTNEDISCPNCGSTNIGMIENTRQLVINTKH